MEFLIVIVVAVLTYLIYRVIHGSNQTEAVQQPTTAPLQHTAAPQHATLVPHGAKSYPFSEFTSDPRFPQIRTIHTKIRGVTKTNYDGSDRQRIIHQCCRSGDALYFVREPRNPVDGNAIQVRRVVCTDVADKPRLGEQLGYLSRNLAEEFAVRMDDDGWVMMAAILNISGEQYGESLGVNIEIAIYAPAPSATPPKKRRVRRTAKAETPPKT